MRRRYCLIAKFGLSRAGTCAMVDSENAANFICKPP
jgi:hypothetical protein